MIIYKGDFFEGVMDNLGNIFVANDG